ncbi:hypothetical protein ACFL0L_00370 [Patescibacteria group bacterium]
MEHKRELKKYVDSRRREGASVELIIHGLVLNGWNYADAQQAVTEVIRELATRRSKTKPILIILIILFVIIIAVLAYVLFGDSTFEIPYISNR